MACLPFGFHWFEMCFTTVGRERLVLQDMCRAVIVMIVLVRVRVGVDDQRLLLLKDTFLTQGTMIWYRVH
jgi:hypothetical protein